MTRARIGKLIFAVVFGLAIIIWIFWFPFTPGRIYRVIPENALFLSSHRNLAGRWRVLLDSPLMNTVLKSFGHDSVEQLIPGDDGLERLLNVTADRTTAVAYVPSLAGNPAWVVASWMGGYSQFIRWFGASHDFGGFELERVRVGGGHKIWTVKNRGSLTGRSVSLALVDGVLVVCLSRDPLAARHLFHYAAMDPGKGDGFWQRRMRGYEGNPDCGWISAELISTPGFGDASYTLEEIRSDRMAVKVRISSLYAGAVLRFKDAGFEPADNERLKELRGVLNHEPALLAACPAAIPRWGAHAFTTPETDPLEKLLMRYMEGRGPFFVSLFGGENCGRIMGLAVPAITAGVRVRDGKQVFGEIGEAVDLLNSELGTALLPRSVTCAGKKAVVIDDTKPGFYGKLDVGEKVAVINVDDWLIVSSSFESLCSVMGSAPANNEDVRSVSVRGGEVLAGRINITETLSTLRNGLAALYLGLKTNGMNGAERTRRLLTYARQTAEITGHLRDLTVSVRPQSGFFEIDLAVTAAESNSAETARPDR